VYAALKAYCLSAGESMASVVERAVVQFVPGVLGAAVKSAPKLDLEQLNEDLASAEGLPPKDARF
jgi:tRNA G37 N-methylase TrmD